MNYILLLNWAWETIPGYKGYKAAYMNLFLAIVDSINRNRWQETSVPYELLTNKAGISKAVYLFGRDWLIQNGFLIVEPGRNHYQMAKYSLGIEVQKCAGTDTGTITASDTGTNTGTDTHYNKHKTRKPKTTKHINIPFNDFWDLYDKKVGEARSKKEWEKLTDEERKKAIAIIPAYKQSKINGKDYRKDPANFLNEKRFNCCYTMSHVFVGYAICANQVKTLSRVVFKSIH